MIWRLYVKEKQQQQQQQQSTKTQKYIIKANDNCPRLVALLGELRLLNKLGKQVYQVPVTTVTKRQ